MSDSFATREHLTVNGQKMSKSYGNTIEIFGEEKMLRKKIMGIVMDSRTPAEPDTDTEAPEDSESPHPPMPGEENTRHLHQRSGSSGVDRLDE